MSYINYAQIKKKIASLGQNRRLTAAVDYYCCMLLYCCCAAVRPKLATGDGILKRIYMLGQIGRVYGMPTTNMPPALNNIRQPPAQQRDLAWLG